MKIIGLTGGIGSGKSTVLQLFKELGVATYIADVEAKKLMRTNKQLISQIKNMFGEQAYINKKLNRKYISEIVFKNKEKLKALNALVHPKVQEHFRVFVKKTTANFIIYEAAILFESGSNKFCDFTITVTATLKNKIERIIKRDKITETKILEIMKQQSDDDFKIKKSDFVIKNNNLEETKVQVKTVYNLLVKLNK